MTFGNGREVWAWHMQPGADNHLLDCGVLAAVGASTLAVSLNSLRGGPVSQKSVKFSDLQKARA